MFKFYIEMKFFNIKNIIDLRTMSVNLLAYIRDNVVE